MIRIGYIIAMMLFLLQNLNSQGLQEKKVSVAVNNITIEQALQQLIASDGINFSYQSNLRSLQKRITLTMNDQPLSQVLSAILENSGLVYKVFSNQVVIQSSFVTNRRVVLEGKICISGTYEPVPYAGVELKMLRKGTIADHDGQFRFEVEEKNFQDTIRISSLNYNLYQIPAHNLVRGFSE